jgi:hypothetical protein
VILLVGQLLEQGRVRGGTKFAKKTTRRLCRRRDSDLG